MPKFMDHRPVTTKDHAPFDSVHKPKTGMVYMGLAKSIEYIRQLHIETCQRLRNGMISLKT